MDAGRRAAACPGSGFGRCVPGVVRVRVDVCRPQSVPAAGGAERRRGRWQLRGRGVRRVHRLLGGHGRVLLRPSARDARQTFPRNRRALRRLATERRCRRLWRSDAKLNDRGRKKKPENQTL